MSFALENLRLKELVTVVRLNKDFFTDFCEFLGEQGYKSIFEFINESSDSNATAVIKTYLLRESSVFLFDGVGRPYNGVIARWYFLAWLLRDAPAQRLQPMLSSCPGNNIHERRAYLLNKIRSYLRPLFNQPENWSWAVVSEVMLARLEGSRRSLKGTLFEEIVRGVFRKVILKHSLNLQIGEGQKKIHDETYDVQINCGSKSILVPVKTRETMGGGHANLFTRDIFKAISVAHENGFECVPIVIAESWGGDLEALKCLHFLYLKLNPNQTDVLGPLLEDGVEKMIPFLKKFAESN